MRCWYSRWQLSNALDRGELDHVVARGHAASCARCQGYATSLQALHTRLREGAALAPEPAALAPRRRRMLIAPLVVASAAAVAVAIAVRSPGDPPTEPVVATPAPAIDNARAIASRVTHALTAERTSLDAELDALVALLGLRDVRRAD
jgi:ferric-dicitrate binding protein FerR (iron transport regulator)